MTLSRFLPPKDWRARVVDRAPTPLLTHAHEVGIAVALAIVALPLVASSATPPESIHSQVPRALALFWAWSLLLSSAATLWGLFRHRPRAEWAGQLFMGYGLSFYALALVFGAGWQGVLVSAIFGVLGVTSWWSAFKISSAPQVQHRLIREARYAHEAAHVTRLVKRQARRRGGTR